MKKKENIFGIAIFLILILNFSFVLAQEINKDIFSFDSEKVDYKVESEYGKEVITLTFTDGGFAEIKGVRFENILPSSKSLSPSYIKIDNKGNILEADLTANEEGSTFLIQGLTIEVPKNTRVNYDINDGFYMLGGKITNIDEKQFVNLPIYGDGVSIFDEFFLDSGRVVIQKNGYLFNGEKAVYRDIQIIPEGDNDFLIEKNPSRDLSKFQDNFIQETDSGLKIQSFPDATGFNLRFLEGNDFFEVDNKDLPPNVERTLSMFVSGGDSLEITEKDFIIKVIPPLIKHTSAGEGLTIIKNGRHTFKFEGGKYLSEPGNLNTQNKLSVNFNLDSDILKDKSINIDDDNGYSIYEPKTGENIFTFDKTLLSKPNYNFESEIGKKMLSFAEDQVGNSAFVREGRGKCYGEEEKLKGFDCIGLGIASLRNVYPGSSSRDFPPNLQLIETLEKKGWSSSIIEPAEIVGEKTAGDSVKNIPPGSIIFLTHPETEEDITQSYDQKYEGIIYQRYLNSNKEEVFLNLGHTLIRGTGEKNFINAIPGDFDDELPLRARKINENLIKQGKQPIFIGPVREGEMVPQEDYLLVISPPKT